MLYTPPKTQVRQKVEKIQLWPDGAPGAHGNGPGDKPSLTIYLTEEEQATGTGIVICPGGAYVHLAIEKEGHKMARWFQSIGVAAFVLEYRLNNRRLTGYTYPAQLQDGKRAIRMVRAKAEEWGVNPYNLGIMGFSAGGHLASLVSTHFDNGKENAKDPIERKHSRPDFSVLCYPLISLTTKFTHRYSRRSFLGDNPEKDLLEKLSSEKQVTPMTPPAFLVHADDDKDVPSENSILYYQALKEAGIPASLHIYPQGGHGFGMARGDSGLSQWLEELKGWLLEEGFVSD